MDDHMPVFPEGLTLDVGLRPGVVPRFLRVELIIESYAEEDSGVSRCTPPDAVSRFLLAVTLGLFSGPAEGERAELLQAHHHPTGPGAKAEQWFWELRAPSLSVDAVRTLARMFWRVPGARSVRLLERTHLDTLTVHSIEAGPPSRRRWPWTVENYVSEQAKNAVILVSFDQTARPDVVRAAHETLRGWANVAEAGGFSGGAECPCSAAILTETGTELASEVFATFQDLCCGSDAWDALFHALLRIHAIQPIVRVEIR